MQCGPGTALRPGSSGRVLVCPRCRWEREVPGRPLFVVTGASAAGKTTVTSALAKALPACEVFDVDVTLHVAALGWDVWRNTWLQLAHSIALNGRSTVLCGSLMPDQLTGLPARCLVGPLHFCTLDCPDEILAARLRARPAWRGFDDALVVQHQKFAGWLRGHIAPSFDTSVETPEAVARRIAEWVRERDDPTGDASGRRTQTLDTRQGSR